MLLLLLFYCSCYCCNLYQWHAMPCHVMQCNAMQRKASKQYEQIVQLTETMACKTMWVLHFHIHRRHLKWIQLQFEMNTQFVWYVFELFFFLSFVFIYRFVLHKTESLCELWTFRQFCFVFHTKKSCSFGCCYCSLLLVSNKNIFVALPFCHLLFFIHNINLSYVDFAYTHTHNHLFKWNKLLVPFSFRILLLSLYLSLSRSFAHSILLLSVLLLLLYLSHRIAF